MSGSKSSPRDRRSPAERPRRIFGAHAAHLRRYGLRSSLTHQRMRSLRCSAVPSIWAAWSPNLSARDSAVLLNLVTFVAGFIVAAALYPVTIRTLRQTKAGPLIQEGLPESHQRKAGTPTRGRALFVALALLRCLLPAVPRHP